MSLVSEGRSRLRVLGVPVDALGMSATLSWVDERVRERKAGSHLCVNAANVVLANEDDSYRSLLERADAIGADGQPFIWAARLLGHDLPERVAGIDLMERILERAREAGWRIYLLGARAQVVERLAGRLAADGVMIAGHRDGYFDDEEAPAVAAQIAESGADVLFVGMPTPIKERFIVEHAAPAGIPAAIGVGGSFDVLAGELRRAPRVMQRLGLEWLFRLMQEPRRLFGRYASTNTKFVGIFVRSALRRRRGDAG